MQTAHDHAAHFPGNGAKATAAPGSVLRVGAVAYTNTLPLIHGLDDPEVQRAEGFSLELATPRVLSERLRAEALDLALIPTVEFLRGKYELLTPACIGCMGPVRSVFVAAERPIAQCRRILLDSASRSSVALLQVLLKHLWKSDATLVHSTDATGEPPIPGALPHECDAALVIGDRALRTIGRFPYEEDLGAAWYELTNLPFVFAVWAARPGVDLGEFPRLLCATNRSSAEHTEEMARRRAAALGIAPSVVVEYLTECIRYRLGDRELAAMEMFYRLLHDMTLCPTVDRLNIYEGSAGVEVEKLACMQG